MQNTGRSNLKAIASALFDNNNGPASTGTPVPPKNRSLSLNPKALPSLHELKRRSSAVDPDVYSRSSKSDASSLYDVEGSSKRKADSIEISSAANDDGEEFFDCEDDVRSQRSTTVEPPAKKTTETDAVRLSATINGKAKLRYWDSADAASAAS